MAKKKPAKKKAVKKKAGKYDTDLKIKASFLDVINIAVKPKPSKDQK